MKKILGITLGIMTALGGFVDLGQIVFAMQAGALFGYSLLWVVVLGTIAIIVYMEMCGRVAVVAREPVFSIVRDRLGFKLGLVTLVASNLLNLLTCAAELGGIAIILHLLFGWPEKVVLVAAPLVLGVIVFLFRFQWIERVFGLSGVVMVVFAVTAVALGPNWHAAAKGLIPGGPSGGSESLLLYAYFAVAMFSAILMEYEVHFYSSGAMEEGWKVKDLPENFMVACFGSVLGTLLTIGLLMLGAMLFMPAGIFPDLLSTAPLAGASAFGEKALVLAMIGVLACITGAAVETALSGGYNLCQFFNFRWGKNLDAKEAPVFTVSWIVMLALALLLALTGVRPLRLINVTIIFSAVLMPFTYYPILRAAGDPAIMGKHVNGRLLEVVATALLVLITIAAVVAVPLMLLTHGGKP